VGEVRLQTLFIPHAHSDEFVGIYSPRDWWERRAPIDARDEYHHHDTSIATGILI
jgi:hypothetical protein